MFFIIAMIVISFGIVVFENVFNNAQAMDTTTQSLNETILANSGTANTLSQTPTSLTATTYNQTWLDFDGINNPDNIINSTFDNWNNQMTFSYWFNRKSISDDNTLFSTKAPCEMIFRLGSNNDTKVFFNTSDSSTWANTANNTGDWQHGFVIFDGDSNTAELYANGIKQSPDTGATADICTTNNLYVGKRIQNGGDLLNSSLDNFYIYNSTISGGLGKRLWREDERGSNWGKSINVVSYHSFHDDTGDDNVKVTPMNFSLQMAYLNSSGFETITYDDYFQWRNDNFTLPNKPIIIVFDDGHLTVYTEALSNMTQYGFKGVVAIPTNRPDLLVNYMNWSHLQNLSNLGWQIASHSINGSRFLDQLIPSQWIDAFNNSKNDIENNLTGVSVTTWVYPGNSNNLSTDDLCDDYYTICTGVSGNEEAVDSSNKFIYKYSNLTHEGLSTSNNLGRYTIRNYTTLEMFKSEIDLDYDRVLQYKLNENSGTTAYDVSGNGNNGTISGATYDNDGVLNTLVNVVDYTLSGATFTIVNTLYSWDQVSTSYDYASVSGSSSTTVLRLVGIFVALAILIFLLIPLKSLGRKF